MHVLCLRAHVCAQETETHMNSLVLPILSSTVNDTLNLKGADGDPPVSFFWGEHFLLRCTEFDMGDLVPFAAFVLAAFARLQSNLCERHPARWQRVEQ